MRFLRIEFAIAALMLAPVAGYAISYFVVDNLAREVRPRSAMAAQDGAHVKSLSPGLRGPVHDSPAPRKPSEILPEVDT